MMTKEQRERHMRELTSALVRAARAIRDVGAGVGDAEYSEVWRTLDEALRQRDDFIVAVLDEPLPAGPVERARLDSTGTAQGKTILTAPVVEGGCLEGTMSAGPVATHINMPIERVVLGRAPHVWFDKTNRILHCDHCPDEEELDERSAEAHIQIYAAVHTICPKVSTEHSRREAHRAAFDAASSIGLGLDLNLILRHLACRRST
jgi:hypothetical protein